MKHKRMFAVVLALSILIMGNRLTAFAAGQKTLENSSPQDVVNGMANKAARGMTNTATGWMEFPKQIYLTWQDEGAAKGILVGPFKGVGMTLVRTFAGIGELATFFVAYPGFYDPMFDPSYVWQKE